MLKPLLLRGIERPLVGLIASDRGGQMRLRAIAIGLVMAAASCGGGGGSGKGFGDQKVKAWEPARRAGSGSALFRVSGTISMPPGVRIESATLRPKCNLFDYTIDLPLLEGGRFDQLILIEAQDPSCGLESINLVVRSEKLGKAAIRVPPEKGELLRERQPIARGALTVLGHVEINVTRELEAAPATATGWALVGKSPWKLSTGPSVERDLIMSALRDPRSEPWRGQLEAALAARASAPAPSAN